MKLYSWPMVVVVVSMVAGAVISVWLGSSEVAGVLAGLAGGILVPTRGPAAQSSEQPTADKPE